MNGHNVQKAATLTAGATGAQAALRFNLGPKETAVVQVDLGSSGTVRIQGRLSPEAAWRDLGTGDITSSGITLLSPGAPEMRANVTANGSTVDVWLKA